MRAAQKSNSVALEVIEITPVAEYAQFRAGDEKLGRLAVHSLGLSGELKYATVAPALFGKLTELAPDVVFVPGWSMVEALAALLWCAENNVPSVIMSESTQHDFDRQALKELCKRRIVNLASALFVGGTAHAEYGIALGFPQERISFGYDVVENSDFEFGATNARNNAAAVRNRLNLPDDYFFAAARLIEKKNHLRLLEAFANFLERAEGNTWGLVIAGPGPMKAELEAKVDHLGIADNVRLLGALKYEEMIECYGLAGALIHPSTTEQWGLVVNEAMAAGLPVLVSERCGCAPDLILDGRNGFTFDPFNVDEIADVMMRIADPKCDRIAMGLESTKIIADWGPDRFAYGFEMSALTATSKPMKNSALLDHVLLRLLSKR